MIRKVAQRLHRLPPYISCGRRPARIAIELLKPDDERLDECLLAVARVLPDLRVVQDNARVDDARGVPAVNDALRAADRVELLGEIRIFKDGAGPELLGHAGLPCAWTPGVHASPDVLAGARGVQSVVDDGAGGVVVAGLRRHFGFLFLFLFFFRFVRAPGARGVTLPWR